MHSLISIILPTIFIIIGTLIVKVAVGDQARGS